MASELLEEGRKALLTGEWDRARAALESAAAQDGTAEVYEELAWACWWLNDIPAVFEYRPKAYQLFLERNDKLGASRNASWLGLDYIELKGEFAIANGWFQRAENLLEHLPASWELGFIKTLKARWTFEVDKDSARALKLTDESLALCKSLNNVEGEMLAEALKGFILVMEGRISEGMPLLDDATLLAVTTEKGDVKITAVTCCYLIDACNRIRDFERASQWCNNVKEICKRWKYKAMFASCRVKYAGVLVWNGRWQEAEEELELASTALKESRPLQASACTVRLADLRRRQGKWEAAEALFDKIGPHPLKALYCAALYFDQGAYEDALNLAGRFLRQVPAQRKAERTAGVELLLNTCLKLHRMEEAEALLDELRDIASSIDTMPIKAALLGAEGHLNFARDNYEAARQNFEDAIDIYDRIKSPFDAGRLRLALSEALIALDQKNRAEKELNTAKAGFTALGAAKDLEKATAMLEDLHNGNAGKVQAGQYVFTGRELEVLRLVAQGKNNEEIAETLFLSVRTVETHLSNLYSKMGVSGKSARAFAVSYAIKHKLVFD